MRQVNITAEMLAKMSPNDERSVLDDPYYNYDSKLVIEDLEAHELKHYLERRPDIVQGSYGYYDYDEYGISTFWITRTKIRHRRVITTKGLFIVRNKAGSYDVHEFWRK